MLNSHEKIKLDMVQFYISHTCNLSCPNCLSLNNFSISGHEEYNQDLCKKWSDIVEIDDLTIIGGEPMSNPHLDKWVTGLRNLFSNVIDFKICTNGLLLDKWSEQIKDWIKQKVVIEISVHSSKHLEQINASIDKILEGLEIETFDNSYPNYNYPNYYPYEYNKIIFYKQFPAFIISYDFEFSEWGVKESNQSILKFFDSDPKAAHKACPYKDCHYIYQGEMYKCGTLVGAKELIKKYIIEPKSLNLIDSYKPINLNDDDIIDQLQNITNNAIPQCRLCPIGEHNYTSLENASIKKIPPHKK